MELQPDIWGMCQTTTEPVFPFIKRGRGRGGGAAGALGRRESPTSKASSRESQPQPPRSAVGFISWTRSALGTEVLLVCSEKTLPLSHWGEIPPSPSGVRPSSRCFYIYWLVLTAPHALPSCAVAPTLQMETARSSVQTGQGRGGWLLSGFSG